MGGNKHCFPHSDEVIHNWIGCTFWELNGCPFWAVAKEAGREWTRGLSYGQWVTKDTCFL